MHHPRCAAGVKISTANGNYLGNEDLNALRWGRHIISGRLTIPRILSCERFAPMYKRTRKRFINNCCLCYLYVVTRGIKCATRTNCSSSLLFLSFPQRYIKFPSILPRRVGRTVSSTYCYRCNSLYKLSEQGHLPRTYRSPTHQQGMDLPNLPHGTTKGIF